MHVEGWASLAASPLMVASAKRLTGVDVAALVIAAILTLFGIRSLVTWLRTPFEPKSAGEGALFAVHAAARVGIWLAFAGLFAGFALVDDPASIRGFALIPLFLAAIQLIAAMALRREGSGPEP
jgi:apolipoprotein N-acyltransferase